MTTSINEKPVVIKNSGVETARQYYLATANLATQVANTANAAIVIATTLSPIVKTTSFTLSNTDAGKIIDCNNTSTIICTLPNNLSVGRQFTFRQASTGEILFSTANGATLQAPGGATRTNGTFSTCFLVVMSNGNGANAVYALAGRVY